jgi:hypothetical protein
VGRAHFCMFSGPIANKFLGNRSLRTHPERRRAIRFEQELRQPIGNPEKQKPSRGGLKLLIYMVGRVGFEPTTTALKVQCSTD